MSKKQVNFMNFVDAIFTEELRISSGESALDLLFKNTLKEVFSSQFLKKLNRVFDTKLNLSSFKERSNIMCYTKGTKIFINEPMFLSTPKEKAINYVMHELTHVLINTGKFPELKTLETTLANVISKAVKNGQENEFLTGKKQDIHSNWRGESITYLFNNSIKWDLAMPGTKLAYYNILNKSGIFNLSSSFWKKRFRDIDK